MQKSFDQSESKPAATQPHFPFADGQQHMCTHTTHKHTLTFDQATCNLRALRGADDVTFPQPPRTHTYRSPGEITKTLASSEGDRQTAGSDPA